MQKKLISVAVAGALFAPALALGQSSTVQIYGRLTYEFGFAEQVGRPDSDFASSPGGSAIGFKGEEKLGGNLSAWFQCETSADTLGNDQIGLCSRNSAVGFKGGFGNFYMGRWDTPMKRALNQGTVGAEETGLLGMSFLPFGGSGGANASQSGAETALRHRWKRREAGNISYDSPNFGGFQVLAAVTPANAAGAVNGTPNQEPRVLSIAGTYTAGPLAIGLGYERHSDFGAYSTVAPTVDLDDHAWGIAASYTFGGRIKVGATYLDADYETGVGMSMGKKTWTIGVDWAIAGPHSVHAQYAYARDTDGYSTISLPAANGGVTAPCTGLTATGACIPNSGTGGDAFSIAYQYAFSKRTTVRVGYVKVNNDGATATYRLGEIGSLTGPGANGSNVDTIAAIVKHNF